MTKIAFALSLSALMMLGLCSPAQTEVANDFRREHPSYTVVNVRLEWADSYSATYLIKFKKPGDARTYEVKWIYSDNNMGHKVRRPGMPDEPRLSKPER